MYVGGAFFAEEVSVPEVEHDLPSRVHSSGMPGQQRQRLKLPGGKLHAATIREHSSAGEVYLQLLKLPLVFFALTVRLCVFGGVEAFAAEVGSDRSCRWRSV